MVKSAHHGVGVLEEQDRDRRRRVTRFRGMRGVVLADAQHGTGPGDRSTDAQRRRTVEFGEAGCDGGPGFGDAAPAEEFAVYVRGDGAQVEVFSVLRGYRDFLAGFANAHEFH
ncbi:hypothetical protein ABIA70_003906 [Arthrobacter sp. 754]